MVENILNDYVRTYGTYYVSLGYLNAADADLDGNFGEGHNYAVSDTMSRYYDMPLSYLGFIIEGGSGLVLIQSQKAAG